MGGVLEDKQAKSWDVRNWLPSELKMMLRSTPCYVHNTLYRRGMFEIDYPHQPEDQSQIDSLKTKNHGETDGIREFGPSPINWPIDFP